MFTWLFKPVKFMFDQATIILNIKDKHAQRVVLALELLVAYLLGALSMWAWPQYVDYKYHQKNKNSPKLEERLAPAPSEKK
jgi:hypothetical protein